MGIEIDDLPRRHPQPEAQGDDAARRRAGDQVKVVGDPHVEIRLEPSQHGRREDASQATAIQRQDLEPPATHAALPDFVAPTATSGSSISIDHLCLHLISRRLLRCKVLHLDLTLGRGAEAKQAASSTMR